MVSSSVKVYTKGHSQVPDIHGKAILGPAGEQSRGKGSHGTLAIEKQSEVLAKFHELNSDVA